MKERLTNAEKVKEDGPKLASRPFQLDERVVVQNPITKLWDIHGRIDRKFTDRRYRIQADEGHYLTRNKKYIKLSARAEPGQMQANAPPQEVVNTGAKPAPIPARRESSKRSKKRPRRYLD